VPHQPAGRDAHPVLGYIPTGYFQLDRLYKVRKQLVVADDRDWARMFPRNRRSRFHTRQDTEPHLIPLPSANELARLSKQVFDNNHWNLTTNIEVDRIHRCARRAGAVPRHIGEPSLIQHVFWSSKKPTYDRCWETWPGQREPRCGFGLPFQPARIGTALPVLDNVYAPSASRRWHPWIGMSDLSTPMKSCRRTDSLLSGGDSDDPLTILRRLPLTTGRPGDLLQAIRRME